MGRLANLVNRWSKTISVRTPGTTNEYNQKDSYTTTDIEGRLIQTEEEIIVTAGNSLSKGEKVIAKAKLFTSSDLPLDTKVGNYKIISKKDCENKDSTVEFYKYYLK